jgi:hypothetical protein
MLFNICGTALAAGEELTIGQVGEYQLLTDNGRATFPFDLHGGDIRFEVEIGGHSKHMLLDDGYMWDPILFWGSPFIDSLDLDYDGVVNVGEDDSSLMSRTASGIELLFPGVRFTEQTAVVTPQSSGNAWMWEGSIGQVSGTFLKNFVVDINFDNMTITLIESDGYEYEGRGRAVDWKPMGFGPMSIPITLHLTDGRSIDLEVLMDLGYNTQLQVATDGPNRIPVPEINEPTSLGFNIEMRETRGFKGRMPAITIGGYTIGNPIVEYVCEEHQDHTLSEAMIGLGLLSRFNLVFDYTRQRLYFEPNKKFDEPFESDMSGMRMRRGSDDSFSVVRVNPATPADEVGIKEGDRVISIEGKPVADYVMSELRQLLRRDGESVALVLLRDDQKIEVTLTLRRLL